MINETSTEMTLDEYVGELPSSHAAAKELAEIQAQLKAIGKVRIVMAKPPGPHSDFVEVENQDGASFNAGEWTQEGDLWILTLTKIADAPLGGVATATAQKDVDRRAIKRMRDILHDWTQHERGNAVEEVHACINIADAAVGGTIAEATQFELKTEKRAQAVEDSGANEE